MLISNVVHTLKCPKFYCIPWNYVCDGKWDCPLGEDEVTNDICYKDGFCKGLYKCLNSKLCISPGNICDNFSECPYNDDELFCDLMFVYCPLKCTCLLYGITSFYFDFKVVKIERFIYFVSNIFSLSQHFLI